MEIESTNDNTISFYAASRFILISQLERCSNLLGEIENIKDALERMKFKKRSTLRERKVFRKQKRNLRIALADRAKSLQILKLLLEASLAKFNHAKTQIEK